MQYTGRKLDLMADNIAKKIVTGRKTVTFSIHGGTYLQYLLICSPRKEDV
jgi:hypothetical protein